MGGAEAQERVWLFKHPKELAVPEVLVPDLDGTAKRMDLSTFASIVSPWKDPEKVVQAVNRVAETLPQLVGRYLPWVSKIPLDEGVTWEPTWKAIPNSPYLSQQLRFPTIESEL
ncbi:hypothetical protein TanjilG_01066 [Lupinus angustifolius]|uniref:Uncharacterized protein n=1 Tax=Lupinus angustifolius TaxID=3871 RepID=A0A1J7HRW4_LUPAN|nr:hypothetical protein TanjilG_01066 [Lupinus angustifolius]